MGPSPACARLAAAAARRRAAVPERGGVASLAGGEMLRVFSESLSKGALRVLLRLLLGKCLMFVDFGLFCVVSHSRKEEEEAEGRLKNPRM